MDTQTEYEPFFRRAIGKRGGSTLTAYDFQRRLAVEEWPDLLDVPTGMGKTAAVTLAWLYKRGWRYGARTESADSNTPRRLLWCLPMRVLVEQTTESIKDCLANLGVLGEPGQGKVSVHVLMGGESDLGSWAEHPEEDMIIIGTQDMLLSRALMRGYGMSRYQWPIHFSLLHNDCLWVFDEVQLMGAGLATSTQLEAFRRTFPLAHRSRSLWVSATLNRDWLDTIDLRPHLDTLQTLGINDADRQQAGDRLNATKALEPLGLKLSASKQTDLNTHLDTLCDVILEAHDDTAQTLVIVNRVERAQALFRLLQNARPNGRQLLIHSRFRAAERAHQADQLRHGETTDRIIVATQAVEAGVDISSKLLVTELAPWPSLVQRFGRCNRYGEFNDSGARILWLDIADSKDLLLPYTGEQLSDARSKLAEVTSANPLGLPPTDGERPLSPVLRRKDLLDLFNTDADLSGFDVDVSDYIRDTGNPGVQVFWRDFKEDPNLPDTEPAATRNELCPVSMSQMRDFTKNRRAWYWDTLGSGHGAWTRLDRPARPGMTLLLRASDGAYDDAIGFDARNKKPAVRIIEHDRSHDERAYGEDWRSRQQHSVSLPDHLGHVAAQATALCQAINENNHAEAVIRAGRWHDLGKAHEVFQSSMYRCKHQPSLPYLAKSDCRGPMRHARPYFRHELASMLAWLAQHDGEPQADLIAYLVVAHHGKVRMSLRAMPTETPAPDGRRFARGVWEGDPLPALEFDGEHSDALTFKLFLMELGEGEQGPSWTERSLRLLDEHGPFRLAWLETLVRLADWRASASEQQGANHA